MDRGRVMGCCEKKTSNDWMDGSFVAIGKVHTKKQLGPGRRQHRKTHSVTRPQLPQSNDKHIRFDKLSAGRRQQVSFLFISLICDFDNTIIIKEKRYRSFKIATHFCNGIITSRCIALQLFIN